jgi:iron complex transport system permease protein
MSVSIAGPWRSGDSVRTLSLLALACLVALAAIWALTIGTTAMPAARVVDALLSYDGSRDHIVVIFARLPRVLAGLLVGAALAVAGAIMQAATNNPLASPDLLGINSGAAFAVVMAIIFLDASSSGALIWFAFAGAAVAAVAVYAASSVGPGGATPLKLALAGAVLTSFLAALTTSVLIFDKGTLDQIRLWSAGSLAGRPLSTSAAIAPYILGGLAAAFLFRRQVMTLSLGSDIARSVGQNAGLWRALAAIMVVLLAGSGVALAGPIGFVGLVVPHIARMIVGVDYRWVIPFSALGGSLLLVVADAFARYALSNQSLPVGVTMAVIGAPFFIYLARYRIGGAR